MADDILDDVEMARFVSTRAIAEHLTKNGEAADEPVEFQAEIRLGYAITRKAIDAALYPHGRLRMHEQELWDAVKRGDKSLTPTRDIGTWRDQNLPLALRLQRLAVDCRITAKDDVANLLFEASDALKSATPKS